MLRRLGSYQLLEASASMVLMAMPESSIGLHARVAAPVPLRRRISSCFTSHSYTSVTLFDRCSRILSAQKHRQICSAFADTSQDIVAAETAGKSKVQPQNGHGLSPEQAAAVFAGDGHLRCLSQARWACSALCIVRCDHTPFTQS